MPNFLDRLAHIESAEAAVIKRSLDGIIKIWDKGQLRELFSRAGVERGKQIAVKKEKDKEKLPFAHGDYLSLRVSMLPAY